MIHHRLQDHVVTLGRDVGERNVFRPSALHAAADYIATEWREHGYDVVRNGYPTNGVTCENLSVTQARPRTQSGPTCAVGVYQGMMSPDGQSPLPPLFPA